MIAEQIMDIINGIEYGFKDENGDNLIITNPKKYDDEFEEFYYLMTPDELLEKKCGVCWDQVELERKLFGENGIPVKTYFICTYAKDAVPSHTFLTYEANGSVYWFEHSWGEYRGIHEYSSIKELLLDVKYKFFNSHEVEGYAYTLVYEYQTPPFHITCDEYYKYVETQKLIKLNEPLYFYHVVDKDADLSKGLLTLEYMYNNNMFDLFDRYTKKYIKRITSDWNILEYKGKDILSREDIRNALKIIRGEYGTSYLYFFRYPLYKELGSKIEKLLEVKDIYRININDEEVQKNIKDIFYGYENSFSDNKLLDKAYYENISKEEYFSNYDDDLEFNFSTLNHISIAFIDDYCPIDFLEKVDLNG